ncbi:Uncharacterised protein, partial [Metamycoplasma alkalescens]
MPNEAIDPRIDKILFTKEELEKKIYELSNW